MNSWIRIRIKLKFKREPWRAVGAHNGVLEAQIGALEPWRVYRPVIADSHHLEEDSDPDLGQKLDPDPH